MLEEEYRPNAIEVSVQEFWREHGCFRTTENSHQEKFYCLSMFPYPSGSLHVGHVRNYVLGDAISRYQRMLGKNVLYPIGWDAFGLPAENAALKHGIPPAEWTDSNIGRMREQCKRLGLGFDWAREITTCQPDYYRWEQWLFLQLFRKGLVYRKNAAVNWDPVDHTVLANEQVINGRGWRSGALIERKEIPQWFLKITAYADELLDDLNALHGWPEEVKTMQRHWIGRSDGLSIHFRSTNPEWASLEVFTTRPDTLFGVSFLAVSPQHTLVHDAARHIVQVRQFLDAYQHVPVSEAAVANLEMQGVDTGLTVLHPITHEVLPIWIANFVKADYGCGAVMGVPAHDARDFEFAKKYQLPLRPVIQSSGNKLEHDTCMPLIVTSGQLIHSGSFTGLPLEEATTAITAFLIAHGLASRRTHYRLRDWGVSRQRYWGTPIPIIYCKDCQVVPVPERDLPVLLPRLVQLTEEAPVLKTMPEFYQTTCPNCQQPARRETDTLDTFVESSWYYARFACPDQSEAILDARANYWTPVDHYIGGIEHAVLHLLYARFFHKVLRDLSLLNSNEPFTRLLTQGMVLKNGVKMSKSKGNTVNPEQLIEDYGCDTLRLFVLFAAPPEQSLEWSESGVEGAYRFLKRLWAFAYIHRGLRNLDQNAVGNLDKAYDWTRLPTEQRTLRRQIYEILQCVHHDYERQQFNTVLAYCMKLLNLLYTSQTALGAPATPSQLSLQHLLRLGLSILLRILAPIVPHITHTLWTELGFPGLLLTAEWPTLAMDALATEETIWVVQVNGRLRAHLPLAKASDEETIKKAALNHDKIKPYTDHRVVKKIIIVPEKLINIVI